MKISFWFCSCSHCRPFSDDDTRIPGEVKNLITHVLHVRTNELQYSLHHVSVPTWTETTNDCNVTSHMPHISTNTHQSSFYDLKYNQKKRQSWRMQDSPSKNTLTRDRKAEGEACAQKIKMLRKALYGSWFKINLATVSICDIHPNTGHEQCN